MADEIGEIRSRIDIVDLVESAGIVLKRSGKNYLGLCPFHSDKRPSFTVTSSLGRYRCFSCGESGDIFTWVMKTRNVEFGDALRILAEKAGVTLSKGGSASGASKSEREAQKAAMTFAIGFFRENLAKNEFATRYCSERGLEPKVVQTWELGYAPDLDEALSTALKKAGHSLALAKDLFLVDGDQANGFRDKFRGRLIFPIRDEKGDIVAFGGRVLGDGLPKYINSSDTPLYRKSKVLYGMHQARERLMKERWAVLTEGYLDVIACHRAGLTNALASLGTSMAEDQAKLLKRWCDRITIFYDGDAAGVKAADRAAEMLVEAGLRVSIASLAEGEDPDTLLSKQGPAAVLRAVELASTPIDFRIQSLERQLLPQDEAFWVEAVRVLGNSKSELEITRHIDRLAPLYPGVRDVVAAQRALRNDVRRAKANRSRERQVAVSTETTARPKSAPSLHSAELALLHIYLNGEHRERLHELLKDSQLMLTGAAQLLASDLVRAYPDEPPEGPPSTWLYNLTENTQETIGSLNFDRLGDVGDELMEDAISMLETAKRNREMKALETNQGRMQLAQERLQKLKPDPRNTSS